MQLMLCVDTSSVIIVVLYQRYAVDINADRSLLSQFYQILYVVIFNSY